MKTKALVFDLDGTLLDTIEDIRFSINEALRLNGYDYAFDREGTKHLIGDGADALVRRALKEKSGDLQAFNALKATYMPLYREHNLDTVKPFPGLIEVLKKLKELGIKLFVATNKPDHLAGKVVATKIGPDLFEEVIGIKEGDKVKPDPWMVLRFASDYGLSLDEIVYVGDSHVDIETAANAKVKSCLCLWGYDDYTEALKSRADFLANEPNDLLLLVKE